MKFKTITIIAFLIILLSACATADGPSLDGTSWKLVAFGNQPVIQGSGITISFEDGQVSGHSGCNSYSGEYKLRGDSIEFGMMMSTMMACVDTSMMEQESTFMRLLGQAQRVEQLDGQLQIFWSEDEALIFVPRK